MNKKLFAFLSLGIFLAFTGGLIYIIMQVIAFPQRNFGILWMLPFLISAIDYLFLSIRLLKDKLGMSDAIIIFCLAAVQALLPILCFCAMLSPAILFTFDLLTNLILYLPILFLIVPLWVLLAVRKSQKDSK